MHDRAGVACCRRIEVATRQARRALLRMRSEGSFHHRWTLGDRGSFEIDNDVVDIQPASRTAPGVTHVCGRLWSPTGETMTAIDVEVRSAPGGATEIVVAPAQRLPEWFREDEYGHWHRLAAAACDEVCEEILYFATHDKRVVRAS